MMTEPTPEHRWLQQLVGTWTYEQEWATEPGGEPSRSSGREVIRSLGDLWIIGELEGVMPAGDR